jgi:hypothetical protein
VEPATTEPAARTPTRRGRGRRRLFLFLTLGYALLVSLSIVHAYRSEARSGSRPSLAVALFGGSDAERDGRYRDLEGERSAAFARAGIVLASVLYVFAGMLAVGPRPLQIAGSNGLVLVLTLLGLEGATRLLNVGFPGVVRRDTPDRDLWVYDPTKGWFPSPGGSGEVPMTGPDRARVRINALGLRGAEIPRQKQSATKRVLVFGDSYVFGLGVDEENLFTTHLERLLNARFAAPGIRVEVVNLGVLGYSTDQELILLDELGLGLGPDLVILVVCDNDFRGNTEDFVYRRYYKPYFELTPEGELLRRNVPVPRLDRLQRVKLFLGQESNLWNFARSRRSERPVIRSFIDAFQVGVPRPSSMDPIELTTAVVLAFADRVEASGARPLVINTGHRGEETELFHGLRPRIRRPGLYLLGLEETLANARRDAPDGLWDFGYDAHWNRDSHRLAAEVIDNYIGLNELLP